MRIAKATFALACALAAIAAPTAAYAVPQNTVIMPGDTIKAKYLVATSTCTAAAPVRDNHGGLYLLTAGHCVNGKLGEIVGQPIYHNQKLIGHVRSAQFEIADYAVIKLQSNVKVGHNDVPHFAYLGQVSPDSQICFHGTKSGVRCGKVNRENEITYMRGAFVPGIVIGTSATLRSISGDSGSAVYTDKGVIGILSGGREGITTYVPIESIYSRASRTIPGFRITD